METGVSPKRIITRNFVVISLDDYLNIHYSITYVNYFFKFNSYFLNIVYLIYVFIIIGQFTWDNVLFLY